MIKLESAFKHLYAILSKLNELNFAVKIKKCDFAKNNIKYLGHIIGSGKHEPYPEKLKVIEKLSSPKTKTELQSLIGLCQYYHAYVKGLSDTAYTQSQYYHAYVKRFSNTANTQTE